MSQRSEWVTNVLGSLDGVQRAVAPEDLGQRILARTRTGAARAFSPVAIWPVAAGLALLVALNFYTIMRPEARDGHSRRVNPVAAAYFNDGLDY